MRIFLFLALVVFMVCILMTVCRNYMAQNVGWISPDKEVITAGNWQDFAGFFESWSNQHVVTPILGRIYNWLPISWKQEIYKETGANPGNIGNYI